MSVELPPTQFSQREVYSNKADKLTTQHATTQNTNRDLIVEEEIKNLSMQLKSDLKTNKNSLSPLEARRRKIMLIRQAKFRYLQFPIRNSNYDVRLVEQMVMSKQKIIQSLDLVKKQVDQRIKSSQ